MSESPVTLPDIEAACLSLRVALDAAAQVRTAVDAELTEVRARYADDIRAAAADVEARRRAVLRLIDQARPLFKRPKSQTLHGILAGLRRKGGAWSWPDQSTLVALVRQRLAPSRAAALIQVTEKVKVSTLTADDRKRLGIGRARAVDRPICRESGADTIARLMAILAEVPDPGVNATPDPGADATPDPIQEAA